MLPLLGFPRVKPHAELILGDGPLDRAGRGRPFLPRIRGGCLPELEDDAYYTFQLVGLRVEEEGGRALGTVTEVENRPANDTLELDSGLLLPLVDACVLDVDLDAGRILVARGFADAE